MSDEPTCEVPEVDEHCGSVQIVVDEGGDMLAMCWECRRKFGYQRVVDEDPDPALTDGGWDIVRPPTIYDVAELPESEQTQTCQRWTGEGPTPCNQSAEYVFVYEATLHQEDDTRKNCLACADCCPNISPSVNSEPETATDGGYSVEVTADDGSVPLDTEADLYAYVQDGPTVVVWTFNTTVAGEVQVGEFHVHQGTDRTHGVTYEDIEKGSSLTDFARQFAREHADGGLENARESFGLSTDADRETEVSA